MQNEITTVVHYTSGAEVIGMVEKNVMWATAIQFMNDSAEFALGLELAKQAIGDLIAGKSDRIRRALEAMLTQLDDFRDYAIYVTCFSEAIDSISQWRSYSQSNLGYALEFDLKALRAHASSLGFQLVPCIYDAHGWIARWKDQLESRLVESERQSDGGAALNRCLTDCLEEVVANSARLKHFAFSGEQEWRIVGVKGVVDFRERFRVGRSYMIPYIEFPLPLKSNQKLLKTIRIGPTPSRREARLAVTALVGANSIKPAIEVSCIPYRAY